jgi:hypothetical protein
MLSAHQRICVPIDQGVTGQVFARQKTTYTNDFVKNDFPVWYPETDNLRNF